jgi:hypothetical protein
VAGFQVPADMNFSLLLQKKAKIKQLKLPEAKLGDG